MYTTTARFGECTYTLGTLSIAAQPLRTSTPSRCFPTLWMPAGGPLQQADRSGELRLRPRLVPKPIYKPPLARGHDPSLDAVVAVKSRMEEGLFGAAQRRVLLREVSRCEGASRCSEARRRVRNLLVQVNRAHAGLTPDVVALEDDPSLPFMMLGRRLGVLPRRRAAAPSSRCLQDRSHGPHPGARSQASRTSPSSPPRASPSRS